MRSRRRAPAKSDRSSFAGSIANDAARREHSDRALEKSRAGRRAPTLYRLRPPELRTPSQVMHT